jgi:hypothetical protein
VPYPIPRIDLGHSLAVQLADDIGAYTIFPHGTCDHQVPAVAAEVGKGPEVNGAIRHRLDHRLGLVGEKAVKKGTTTDKQDQKQGKPKRQLVHTSSQ